VIVLQGAATRDQPELSGGGAPVTVAGAAGHAFGFKDGQVAAPRAILHLFLALNP